MTRKTIKVTWLTVLLTAVLCAGTVSARQLRTGPNNFTCGGRCLATADCATGCVCRFSTPFTGFCATHLAGVVPGGK